MTTKTRHDDAIQVGVRASLLGDGSEVHDISIGGAVFHCVTERDAIDFLASLTELVGKYTNDVLRVRNIAG